MFQPMFRNCSAHNSVLKAALISAIFWQGTLAASENGLVTIAPAPPLAAATAAGRP